MKFDLRFFEISDLKYLVKFGGKTFLPGKHQNFQGEFRGKFRHNFRKLRFKFRVFFFRNFVQQKGDVNDFLSWYPLLRFGSQHGIPKSLFFLVFCWAVIWGGAKRMEEENVPENAL